MGIETLLPNQPLATLALASGHVFPGFSIGATAETVGEVVFNTAMTGYQEVLTDPSYADQLVTLTYPQIGNTGVNDCDNESTRIWASGLIIREYSPIVSNWQAISSLSDFLKAQGVVGIAGVDTRALTRLIRDQGEQGGCIMTGNVSPDIVIEKARAFAGLQGKDLAQKVTTTDFMTTGKETRVLTSVLIDKKTAMPKGAFNPLKSNEVQARKHIVVYDFGVKENILRLLQERGCQLTIVPAKTPVESVLALKPDGVVLSNGPGDPAACTYAIDATRVLLEKKVPIFGICLGFQILGLACNAKTLKMKFGHHGSNHPVQDLNTKRVYITSQNHGFMLDADTLPDCLQVTHVSLFDHSIQGIAHKTLPAMAFQGHPEASPGPHDIVNLFDQFLSL